MIKNFKNKATKELFERHVTGKFSLALQRSALRKLLILDAAVSLNDLRSPPSNHLESLKGDRVDEYSIRINKQWRICFKWHDGNTYEVEIIDYH